MKKKARRTISSASRRRFFGRVLAGAAAATAVLGREPVTVGAEDPKRKRLERLLATYGGELGPRRRGEK